MQRKLMSKKAGEHVKHVDDVRALFPEEPSQAEPFVYSKQLVDWRTKKNPKHNSSTKIWC
jgi:hypothetical protein